LLCVQQKTPDDGQRSCLKHVEFYSKNGFIVRIYHDAQSHEHQIPDYFFAHDKGGATHRSDWHVNNLSLTPALYYFKRRHPIVFLILKVKWFYSIETQE